MNLYESMSKHPDIGPIMELLELVEPCDEFSKALCLVRDCFNPNNTLRALSRRKLRSMMGERTGLMAAYETAVYTAARAHGIEPGSWLEAIDALPAVEFSELRDAYNKQVDALMGRK
jgi:hypothetical protein